MLSYSGVIAFSLLHYYGDTTRTWHSCMTKKVCERKKGLRVHGSPFFLSGAKRENSNTQTQARFNIRRRIHTVINKLFFDFLLIVCNDYSQRVETKGKEKTIQRGKMMKQCAPTLTLPSCSWGCREK